MIKIISTVLGVLFFITQPGIGQTLDNAIRISTLDHTGTARYMGAGGAMTALGADYSSAAYNPAGLALIRRSEVVFTPVLFNNHSFSTWDNERNIDQFNNLQFTNVGLVISSPVTASSTFTNFSFAFGYNRLANFHQNIFSQGYSAGTILDRFIALGDGKPPEEIDDFEVGPAYDVYALIYDDATQTYSSDLDPETKLFKEYTAINSGSVNEIFLSFAGNMEEKLMLGLTMSMPLVSITEDRIYYDEDVNHFNDIYESFEFTEYGEVSGVGFQLKAGLIYRHSQAIRFGLAMHSPAWYSLSDEFYNSATFDYDVSQIPNGNIPPGPQTAESPIGSFDYNFTSPWRVMSGLGFLIANQGFLSFDIEYLDYTSSRYNFTRRNSNQFLSEERAQNNEIESSLGTALNFRVGAEWANQSFRVRGGLQFIQNPFVENDKRDFVWSIGAGIRSDDFFLDLAFQRSLVESALNPYVVPGAESQPTILNEFEISRLALTAGFKF
nr:hypothetical protein [Saprospiraceae bacterium]